MHQRPELFCLWHPGQAPQLSAVLAAQVPRTDILSQQNLLDPCLTKIWQFIILCACEVVLIQSG